MREKGEGGRIRQLESEVRRLQFRLQGLEAQRQADWQAQRMAIFELRGEIAELKGRLAAHRAQLRALEEKSG